MTAFSVAMRMIFADRNMAADAVWYPGGTGPGVAIRAVESAPDEVQDFGQSRVASATLKVDVRVSEMTTPAKGDVIMIGAARYMVQSAPRKDALALIWELALVAAP